MRGPVIAFAAAALSLPLLAAGSSADAAAEPRVHTIAMASMRFGAVPPGIRAGDVIIWVNRDMVPHTATARDGSFDVVLAAHQSRRMRVTRAGSFAVYCRYHPGMRTALVIAR
jgi:plastocyanin